MINKKYQNIKLINEIEPKAFKLKGFLLFDTFISIYKKIFRKNVNLVAALCVEAFKTFIFNIRLKSS